MTRTRSQASIADASRELVRLYDPESRNGSSNDLNRAGLGDVEGGINADGAPRTNPKLKEIRKSTGSNTSLTAVKEEGGSKKLKDNLFGTMVSEVCIVKYKLTLYFLSHIEAVFITCNSSA